MSPFLSLPRVCAALLQLRLPESTRDYPRLPEVRVPQVCAALLQLCALSALTGRLGESDAAGEVSEITRGYGRLPEGRGYTGAWGGTLQRNIGAAHYSVILGRHTTAEDWGGTLQRKIAPLL